MKRLFLLSLFLCHAAIAQTYPTKPVRLIVTYPPGGSSDLMSRVYGAKLAELWGQQVIIESKPGAAGSIGMDFAARQPTDGYTFVVGNLGPVAVNPLLSKVPVRHPERLRRGVADLRRPERAGGAHRLAVQVAHLHHRLRAGQSRQAELRHQRAGQRVAPVERDAEEHHQKVNAVEVAYKGGVLAVQDLLGGQIDFIFSDSLPAMAHIRAGKLRALCVTGTAKVRAAARAAALPGGGARAGGGELVGRAVSRRHSQGDRRQAARATRSRRLPIPNVKKKFADLGVEAVSSTPAQFSAFIKAEMAKYAKLDQRGQHQGESMKQIGVAVVGIGWCGGIRAETLAAHPLVKELHLAEVREDRLEEMEAKTRPTTATTDYKQLLDRKGIDAVYISATPENPHYPIAKDFLKAGKHVFLEKPIAMTLAEADELINISRDKKAEIHHRLFAALQPEVRLRAKCIRDGTIGKPVTRPRLPPHHARPRQEDQRPHQALARGDGVARTTWTSCFWCLEPAKPVRVYSQVNYGAMKESGRQTFPTRSG